MEKIPESPKVKETVIELPECSYKPQNQRIFALEVDPGEVKLKNIIIPTVEYGWSTRAGYDERVNIKHSRYIVVAVADDITVQNLCVNDPETGEIRRIERGDEIVPFFPEDMTHFKFPVIRDWKNGGQHFTMFHYTEIAGTSVTVKKEK